MPHVLVVDDVEEVRYSLTTTLTREGFSVVEAVDGEGALSLMERERFDAVITDLWMPRLDGVELIQRVRSRDETTVLIAVSGGAPKAPINFSVALADTWGADAVFVKPFENEEMVAELRRLLTAAAGGQST